MTLIQTLLSPSRILQVSDRRLTRKGEWVSDSTNKVVSWCGKFMVGFTGPAFMDRHETDLPTSKWIAATLARNGDANGSITDVVEMLRISLDIRYKGLPRTWDRRMTVTVSGFAKYPDVPGDGLTSVCYTISNYKRYDDGLGRVLIDLTPSPNFECSFVRYMGKASAAVEYHHRTDGFEFDVQDMRLIRKLGPRLYKDQCWDGMVRLMLKVQRDISLRGDPHKPGLVSGVGLDAMVMSLPKLAYADPLGQTLLTDVSAPFLADDRPSFTYVPATGYTGETQGPHYACGGTATSFEGEQLSKYVRDWDPVPVIG